MSKKTTPQKKPVTTVKGKIDLGIKPKTVKAADPIQMLDAILQADQHPVTGLIISADRQAAPGTLNGNTLTYDSQLEGQYLPDILPLIAPAVVTFNDPRDIMSSKRYVKDTIQFQAPSEILAPCIELLQQSGGRVTLDASHEVSNQNLDKSINTSYARLNLVSRYEIDTEQFYEVGILIAYDLQVPRIKIYRGAKVAACLNLSIYQSDDVVKFELKSGVNMEQVNHFLEDVNTRIAQSVEIANRLKSIEIPENIMSEIMGKMFMQTIEKDTANGITSIVTAGKLFNDSKSKYYYKQPHFNGWQLFNGFTEHNSKVNFFDIPDKARDTYLLLKDICLS